tara:strand:+ start:751 stop:1497 length:747 start_codon:yes stop_codon:yes gene_type:complete
MLSNFEPPQPSKQTLQKQYNLISKTCPNNISGIWKNKWFHPTNCHFHKFDSLEVTQCFRQKRIAFAGDSLLRNLGGHIATLMDSKASYKKTWGDQIFPHINLFTYWTPSVYHQQITNYNFDIIVISMCVWDMGTYYKGHYKYKQSLKYALKKIKSSFNGRLILFLLHKIYPDVQGCDKKCKEYNSENRANRFRTIQIQVAKELNVETFDTYSVTDTEFARQDSNDAVHYKYTVTHMETQMLLNKICKN